MASVGGGDGGDNGDDDQADTRVLDHCLAALAVAQVGPCLLNANLKTEQGVVVHHDLRMRVEVGGLVVSF